MPIDCSNLGPTTKFSRFQPEEVTKEVSRGGRSSSNYAVEGTIDGDRYRLHTHGGSISAQKAIPGHADVFEGGEPFPFRTGPRDLLNALQAWRASQPAGASLEVWDEAIAKLEANKGYLCF